eukprot:snap_masked-scaffold_13-processed-gene-10.27-mRNA-1 protein AED:0.38 eAED:0.38 QI:0/0/0/0.5/1/1/2/0/352
MNKPEHETVSLSIWKNIEIAQDVPTSRRKLSVRSILLLILGMILFAGFLVYLLREMQVFQEEDFLNQPTWSPSEKPTIQPTWSPSEKPTIQPTWSPSEKPTIQPTWSPSEKPTLQPTRSPSEKPTLQPTRSPSEKPTLQPTLNPTYSGHLYDRCVDLVVGEKMKFQSKDYITVIFVTEVTVQQCMIFLEAAGHVSDYFNQVGNGFFISTYGISFHDLFYNSSIPDVELISPGEQIIDLTVGVGIGPLDGPGTKISGVFASRRSSEGSLFNGSYVGYIYYDILDLDFNGYRFEEKVMDYMFFVAGIDPTDSLLEVGSAYKSFDFGIMDSNELFYEDNFSIGEDEVFLKEAIKK